MIKYSVSIKVINRFVESVYCERVGKIQALTIHCSTRDDQVPDVMFIHTPECGHLTGGRCNLDIGRSEVLDDRDYTYTEKCGFVYGNCDVQGRIFRI